MDKEENNSAKHSPGNSSLLGELLQLSPDDITHSLTAIVFDDVAIYPLLSSTLSWGTISVQCEASLKTGHHLDCISSPRPLAQVSTYMIGGVLGNLRSLSGKWFVTRKNVSISVVGLPPTSNTNAPSRSPSLWGSECHRPEM